jgi:hypothetical protein
VYFVMIVDNPINLLQSIQTYEVLVASTLNIKSTQVTAGITNVGKRRLLSFSTDIEFFVFTDTIENKISIARKVGSPDFSKIFNLKIIELNATFMIPQVVSVRVITIYEKEVIVLPTAETSNMLSIIVGCVLGGVVLLACLVRCCIYSSTYSNSRESFRSVYDITYTRIQMSSNDVKRL